MSVDVDAIRSNALKERAVIINDMDLFAGPYERFKEKNYYGNPNYTDTKILPTENFNSSIIPKRKNLFQILITRPKKCFEAPIINLFQDKNANEESTVGNNEVKGVKLANEYPLLERSSIEMGFQTANATTPKIFQVAKKEYINAYTQVEDNLNDIKDRFVSKTEKYLSNSNSLMAIENFLNKVKPKMEESLQSNETINIFMNDFNLDRFQISAEESGTTKQKGEGEARTYRDNSAGNKAKKEKNVHYIRSIAETEAVIAHSLYRNFTFDEYIKVQGIPYQSDILFWNIKDVEQNSPIFLVSAPGEVTCFEFSATNKDNFVLSLSSGQLMFIKFNNIISILREHLNTDVNSYIKKANLKDFYIYNLSSLYESHKSKVTSLKWFPPGYFINKKKQIIYDPEEKNCCIIASLGEDGQIILWDYKGLELGDPKSVCNDINKYILAIHIEVNKVDSIGRVCGTNLQFDITPETKLFYISTDEGQVYCVDMSIKNTTDNPTANVVQHYYNRYFRPILFFQVSPFFNDIFLTVHDFHFCLWTKNRNKPIFISPNLKKSSYTCGCFSPSRPAVLYLCRSNGKIDIWDFLDESHKPSVKDSFIKDTITSFDIFRYIKPVDENAENQTKTYNEFMCVGDISGQMTLLEVPKLFSEMAQDETNIMQNFFDNEIKRQEYMDMRYKTIEEEINAKEGKDEKKEPENEAERELELKYAEEQFNADKRDILIELDLPVPKTAEELERERKAKENEENAD